MFNTNHTAFFIGGKPFLLSGCFSTQSAEKNGLGIQASSEMITIKILSTLSFTLKNKNLLKGRWGIRHTIKKEQAIKKLNSKLIIVLPHTQFIFV